MTIKVYSTQTCPYCVTLKNFLKEKGFEFEDIDITFDQEKQKEMINKSGQMGVPVLDIDGQIIVGFDREKIVKLLDIKE
jgi:glutaredoxin-like YruB-family protein